MEIETVIARAEIADVLARYARAADRGDMDLLRACYHPDAYDDHGPYKGDLEGLVTFVEKVSADFLATTHHLGHQVIDIEGSHARAETSCLCWYRRQSRSGTVRSIVQGLRYLDNLDKRGGRWAIARRVVVLDWEHVFEAGPKGDIPSTWWRGTRDSSDPSLQFFSAI